MRTNLLIRQPIEGFELSMVTLRPSRADMQIASRKRQKVSEKQSPTEYNTFQSLSVISHNEFNQ